MLEHPILKAAGAVGTAVGLLTGIGTLIGWAATDSFRESAYTAVKVAGGAYFVLLGGVIFLLGRLPQSKSDPFWSRTVPLVGVSISLLLLMAFTVEWARSGAIIGDVTGIILFLGGCVGILMALWFSASWGIEQGKAYRNSRTECLDCAETIKRKARVCPHCGYRFKPPPTLDEQQTVKSN